jgi:hypothetical protein
MECERRNKMDIEIKGSTIEDLSYYAKLIIDEMESRYDDLSALYEALNDDYDELAEEKESSKTYESGYEEGFEKGQEDLQIRAKRILDTFDKWEAYELVDVFGVTTNIELLNDIKTNYEKIVAYENKKKQEEKEIEIGDVVMKDGHNYIVFGIYGNDSTLDLITKDGLMVSLHKKFVTKTGKHYPIDEMLKEL